MILVHELTMGEPSQTWWKDSTLWVPYSDVAYGRTTVLCKYTSRWSSSFPSFSGHPICDVFFQLLYNSRFRVVGQTSDPTSGNASNGVFFLNGKDQILLGVAAEQNSYRNFAVLPGSQKQGTLESMNGTSERLPREFWWDRFPRFRLPSPAWHHGEVSIETSWVSGYQSGTGRTEDREALLNNATEMSYVAIMQETMVGFQGFQGSKDQFVRKHFSWSFHGKLMLENSLKTTSYA